MLFAGTGVHQSKKTGENIQGSPLNALQIDPPFKEYFFIDKNPKKIEILKSLTQGKNNVHIIEGDCNQVLVDQVYPNVQYNDYKRGLCFLDPYGLHLNWDVIKMAGESKAIDIFINFPLYDMKLNVLLCDSKKTDKKSIVRMDSFWGDNSWKESVYVKQSSLFGEDQEIKTNMGEVNQSFSRKIKESGWIFSGNRANSHEEMNRGGSYFFVFRFPKTRCNKYCERFIQEIPHRRNLTLASKSEIEWTESTWNPVTGCTKISPGCKNCYAERMAIRLKAMGSTNYQNGFEVAIHSSCVGSSIKNGKSRKGFL